jgi:tRNA (guanine37-N1)-methyltransferase
MQFDVFTLFPEVFKPYLEASILQRAIKNSLLEVRLHDIRDWAPDKHHVTDDTPYGGGGGMVMKPEPVFAAVEEVLGKKRKVPLVLLTPQGRPFTHAIAQEFARLPRLALLCGHYEGVDERIREHLVSDEISIGDYVLTGGELPAMIVIDAVARFLPGVLGDPGGAMDDSFASGMLEYPQYTRPEVFRGWKTPEVLLSGNHAEINRWRKEQALLRTLERRPDLLLDMKLTKKDMEIIERYFEQKSTKRNGEEK